VATQRQQELNVGDRVRHDRTDWLGTVQNLLGSASSGSAGGAPRVRVLWDRSGASGTEFEVLLHRTGHRIGDGPWQLGEKSPDLPHATATIRDAGGWDVAHCFGTSPPAALIAAAPELRDALSELLGWVNKAATNRDCFAACERAHAALAKASA
jgi:hypothetical protein